MRGRAPTGWGTQSTRLELVDPSKKISVFFCLGSGKQRGPPKKAKKQKGELILGKSKWWLPCLMHEVCEQKMQRDDVGELLEIQGRCRRCHQPLELFQHGGLLKPQKKRRLEYSEARWISMGRKNGHPFFLGWLSVKGTLPKKKRKKSANGQLGEQLHPESKATPEKKRKDGWQQGGSSTWLRNKYFQ